MHNTTNRRSVNFLECQICRHMSSSFNGSDLLRASTSSWSSYSLHKTFHKCRISSHISTSINDPDEKHHFGPSGVLCSRIHISSKVVIFQSAGSLCHHVSTSINGPDELWASGLQDFSLHASIFLPKWLSSEV
jgi:hypothetical protein